MQGQAKDRWLQLCEQAAVEQDPAKLLELIREINHLLEEKRARLDKKKSNSIAELATHPGKG